MLGNTYGRSAFRHDRQHTVSITSSHPLFMYLTIICRRTSSTPVVVSCHPARLPMGQMLSVNKLMVDVLIYINKVYKHVF